MKAGIKNCVARILTDTGQVVGAGFVVGSSHVITCAHVVNLSLRRKPRSKLKPTKKVILDFPFFKRKPKVTAQIVMWNPNLTAVGGDVAVLKLDKVPKVLSPVFLVEAEPEELKDHEFETYGFPIGNDPGGWARGHILRERPNGSIQLAGRLEKGGYRIQRGFSGAPVLDEKLNGLVGMLVAAERQPGANTAFMIPTKLLVEDNTQLKNWVTPPYPQAIWAYMGKICELYKGTELGTTYIPLSAKLSNNRKTPDTVQYLKNVLRKRPSSSVLVLGDYGSGKTNLAFRLTYELADEAIRNRMRTTIPFYMNLSFSKGRKLTSAIPDYLDRYNIQLTESDLLHLMNHRPNLVFILDGFDEMANRTNWRTVPSILDRLSHLRVAAGIRTVIMSRTTFFRDKIE